MLSNDPQALGFRSSQLGFRKVMGSAQWGEAMGGWVGLGGLRGGTGTANCPGGGVVSGGTEGESNF